MGTVATRLPPTVEFNPFQAEGAGQQLSVGKQWQSEAIAGAARATRELNVQAFMVERCERDEVKFGGGNVDPFVVFIQKHSTFLGPFDN